MASLASPIRSRADLPIGLRPRSPHPPLPGQVCDLRSGGAPAVRGGPTWPSSAPGTWLGRREARPRSSPPLAPTCDGSPVTRDPPAWARSPHRPGVWGLITIAAKPTGMSQRSCCRHRAFSRAELPRQRRMGRAFSATELQPGGQCGGVSRPGATRRRDNPGASASIPPGARPAGPARPTLERVETVLTSVQAPRSMCLGGTGGGGVNLPGRGRSPIFHGPPGPWRRRSAATDARGHALES